jgi:hypothetical protein
VPPKPLARVADPAALDRATGPQAKLELQVPASWIVDGCALEVAVPKLINCARCDGGGCDSCGRRGALRAPAEQQRRTIQVSLPGDHTTAVQLRLVDPFVDSEIEQLLVCLHPGSPTTAGVRRIERDRQLAPTSRASWIRPALMVAVVVLTLLWVALALTR